MSARSGESARFRGDFHVPRKTVMASPTKLRSDWLLPAALLLLTAIPAVAGGARLASLALGAKITPENARFYAAPWPVVLHVVSAVPFNVLGAFQLAPGYRRRWPRQHRVAGRALIVLGIVAATSGLWMTRFYPPVTGDGPLLYGFRLLFGSAMLGSLLLGFAAARRRDFATHGAWLTRGYAIGMGAGTQALAHLPWLLLVGRPGELARALLMGAGWIINLGVAEWTIRRKSHALRLRAPTGATRATTG
jgi:uncharacterized membrane protein